jgi:hypothetical protein
MNNNAPNGILALVAVAAADILAVVFLQTLGKTSVRDDYDMPPLGSGR